MANSPVTPVPRYFVLVDLETSRSVTFVILPDHATVSGVGTDGVPARLRCSLETARDLFHEMSGNGWRRWRKREEELDKERQEIEKIEAGRVQQNLKAIEHAQQVEAEMAKIEAEGDRDQTEREERAKHDARARMERAVRLSNG